MQKLLPEAAKHSCRVRISAASELPLHGEQTSNVYKVHILSLQQGRSECLPLLTASLPKVAVVLQIGCNMLSLCELYGPHTAQGTSRVNAF